MGLALLQSCGGRVCSCYQQCQYFKNDSISICSVNYPTDSAFQVAIDSAIAEYGQTTKDSSINYRSIKYNANEVSQLETQGYNCQCFDNGW